MMDIDVHDPVAVAEAVNGIFRENAQTAAMGIVWCALHEPNSKIRLDASKYILEAATKVAEGSQDPLAVLVQELYSHLDVAAKEGAVQARDFLPTLPTTPTDPPTTPNIKQDGDN